MFLGCMDDDPMTDDQESRRILERVARESGPLGGSEAARAARQALDHLVGRDAPAHDPVEVWARRIGRGLGVIAAIYLLGQLILHFAGH
jgi:hypothetical protein